MRRALQKYIEDPLSETLIQGVLERPADLEIFVGENGMYYRYVGKDGEEAEGEGSVAVREAELLYMF